MLGIVKNLSDKSKRRRRKSDARRYIQYLFEEYKLAENNNNKSNCKSYLLMDENCFEELLEYVQKEMSLRDAHLTKSVTPVEKCLAITLRFLANGESFKELSESTLLTKTFLKANIIEMCEIIYKKLKKRFLKFPHTKKEWLSIVNDFQQRSQFPHCLGALGVQHIANTPTKKYATSYTNNRVVNSMALIAIANANEKFICIDIVADNALRMTKSTSRSYLRTKCSSTHTQGTTQTDPCGLQQDNHLNNDFLFKSSKLCKIFQQSDEFFPKDDYINRDKIAPYVMVADNSFPLMYNLIRPFTGTLSEPSIINYNLCLSKAKESVENAFSIMREKFKILQKDIKLDTAKSTKIILCCCVLHNFLMEKSLWYKQNSTDYLNETAELEEEQCNEISMASEASRSTTQSNYAELTFKCHTPLPLDNKKEDELSMENFINDTRKIFIEYFSKAENL
ncbi:uncharacterized protein LOC119670771 [Teleopsis dalmanni]|uniref:uncharacterized protein LOC119670771 n=1 Tax=Teleopsis dalmanni TaxID=139649 RepID=UPI0018CFDB97|nr:uncharacterized protein LOC119670771 [Teleopsis dalmanni]